MIVIEGAQGVGKTYLLERYAGRVYKFPYVRYFREFLKRYDADTGHGSREAHHHTTGYDVTLLSMNRLGLLPKDLIIDRGFVSNIVLSIIEGRSTEEEGYHYIDWLDAEGYLKGVHIILLRRAQGAKMPNRSKDEWEFLRDGEGYAEQDRLFAKFCDYAAHRKEGATVHELHNSFGDTDVPNFFDLVVSIQEGRVKLTDATLLHPGVYEIYPRSGRAVPALFSAEDNTFNSGNRRYTRPEVEYVKLLK
jgi:hypothetical protein